MKRVKSYHEKIRPQKARYTTTICERTRCPHFTAIASPRYAGICVNLKAVFSRTSPEMWVKPGLRKCLLKRRKPTEKQGPSKRVKEVLNGTRD